MRVFGIGKVIEQVECAPKAQQSSPHYDENLHAMAELGFVFDGMLCDGTATMWATVTILWYLMMAVWTNHCVVVMGTCSVSFRAKLADFRYLKKYLSDFFNFWGGVHDFLKEPVGPFRCVPFPNG